MDDIDNFRERALEVAKDLEVFSEAYNVGTLRNRAEEAASRAVHDASRRIEEAMAKAEMTKRRILEEAERDGKGETDSMKREKLIAALERGDRLQEQVTELESSIAELRRGADEAQKEKSCVESASKEAWLEVAALKQEVAELKIKKSLLEEQAAEARGPQSKGRCESAASGDTSKSSTKSSRSWKRLFVMCRTARVAY
ncbi:unnamed protein product [Ostreobium quekettii]|uniref:Uncharacterized protein n=1 Tax=Ostreobium quekettii TaxID=121088 RepID=A0A8S1J7X7_9CHLO|nr:unnamed protein product [Ostreobium quekettii]|eukprot:evm.model.scf_2507.2 EVM.evm.TU.scf_2507.2   scf_2507:16269-19340(+)